MGYPEQKLNVEPTLFEWTGWYTKGMPKWMTPDELTNSGFEVDTSYVPFMATSELINDEPTEEYYNRSFRFLKHLLESDGKILIFSI